MLYSDNYSFTTADHEADDLEVQIARYKPESLDSLCKTTKFTKKELQIMYRGFKQVLACH